MSIFRSTGANEGRYVWAKENEERWGKKMGKKVGKMVWSHCTGYVSSWGCGVHDMGHCGCIQRRDINYCRYLAACTLSKKCMTKISGAILTSSSASIY